MPPPNGGKEENAIVQTIQLDVSIYYRAPIQLPTGLPHTGEFTSESLHTELVL